MSTNDRTRLGVAALVFILLGAGLLLTIESNRLIGEPYPEFVGSPRGYVGLKMLADSAVDLETEGVAFSDRLISIGNEPFAVKTLRARCEASGTPSRLTSCARM